MEHMKKFIHGEDFDPAQRCTRYWFDIELTIIIAVLISNIVYRRNKKKRRKKSI